MRRTDTVIALNICALYGLGNWNWKDKGKKEQCALFFCQVACFLCSPYAYSALVSAHVCISQYIKCAYLVHMLLLSVFQSSTLLISCSGWALVDLTVPRIQIAPYSCVSLRHWGREETLNHHPSPYIYNLQLTLSFKFHQTRSRGSSVCW